LKISGHRHFNKDFITIADVDLPIYLPMMNDIEAKCEWIDNGYRVNWKVKNGAPMSMRLRVKNFGQTNSRITSPWLQNATEFSFAVVDPTVKPVERSAELFPFQLDY